MSRPRLSVVLDSYGSAQSEQRCEELLSREMECFGWSVERQPWVWGPRIGWRRPDIYATRHAGDFKDVLCIELKHDLGFHSKTMITALEQSVDYRNAVAWTTADGVSLSAPTMYAVSSTALLGRHGKRGMSDTYANVDYRLAVAQFEQMAWRDGVYTICRRDGRSLSAKRYSATMSGDAKKPRIAQSGFFVCRYGGYYAGI